MKTKYLVTEMDLEEVRKQLSIIGSQVGEFAKQTEVKKWLNEDQAKNVTGMCDKTLRKYRQEGILPYSQIGRKIFYSAEDIDQFIRGGYHTSRLSDFISRRKDLIKMFK